MKFPLKLSLPTIPAQVLKEVESDLKHWKHGSHGYLQGISWEVKSFSKIWKHREKIAEDYHLTSFGPKNKLFP
jgi:hypothetical protein